MANRRRKRKWRVASKKKKLPPLDTVFNCPFCGHEKTVDCKILRDSSIGIVECRWCTAKHECVISHLEEEIDVYSKWIDALEEVQEKVRVETATEDIEKEEERARKKVRREEKKWENIETPLPSAKYRRHIRPKPAIEFTDDDDDE